MAAAAAPAPAKKRSLRRRIAAFVIAFAISLVIGKFFETVASQETLDGALRAQQGWMTALEEFSPWALADEFGRRAGEEARAGQRQAYIDDDGNLAFTEPHGNLSGLLFGPLKAFFATLAALIAEGGVVGLIQLGLGALAVGAGLHEMKRREGKDMPPPVLFLGWPLAVIVAASVIAAALKFLMTGALFALSWATELAASAAGAGGIIGFCWYCTQKLGEKGAEHVLTPKI
jgi:hypothetical protein